MSLAIVTNGYLFASMLVAALALARPNNGFAFRKQWETKLAFAFGFGIFLVAMWVFAEITS